MKNFLAVVACLGTLGADWRQFRGNDASGAASEGTPPTSWSEKNNIAWKVELPGRGLSGPIVVGDRVFLTCSSGFRQDRLHVLGFDAKTGKKLWERQAWATGRTSCHPKTCMAAPTPASDGQRLFCFYSCNDLLCLDLDGKVLWLRGLTADYPNASNTVGMSSSPVVVGDTVIVQVENDSQSFAAGLDVRTGENRWKIDRPKAPSWSSPIVSQGADGQPIVVLLSTKLVSGHDPATGRELWKHEGPTNPIPSCVSLDQTVFAPGRGLTALRPQGYGKPPAQVWHQPRLAASTSSPVLYQGRLYTLGGPGILSCGDAQTGKLLWQLRLKGPFSATPVAAGGYLYCFNEEGVAQVVKPGDNKGEIVATIPMNDVILCTPAVAGDALFVRSDKTLWKIAKS